MKPVTPSTIICNLRNFNAPTTCVGQLRKKKVMISTAETVWANWSALMPHRQKVLLQMFSWSYGAWNVRIYSNLFIKAKEIALQCFFHISLSGHAISEHIFSWLLDSTLPHTSTTASTLLSSIPLIMKEYHGDIGKRHFLFVLKLMIISTPLLALMYCSFQRWKCAT